MEALENQRKIATSVQARLRGAAEKPEPALSTGENLKGWCTAGAPGDVAAFCLGFLNGAVDVYAGAKSAGRPQVLFCLPPGERPTPKAVRAIFLGYAAAHPEQLGQPAVDVVLLALRQAFPCGRPQG